MNLQFGISTQTVTVSLNDFGLQVAKSINISLTENCCFYGEGDTYTYIHTYICMYIHTHTHMHAYLVYIHSPCENDLYKGEWGERGGELSSCLTTARVVSTKLP